MLGIDSTNRQSLIQAGFVDYEPLARFGFGG
jgi:hypothetical protein